METPVDERKRNRSRILGSLLSLLIVVALLFLFFTAIFHFRPPFAVADLSTAAFVIVLLNFIQKLEPVIGALALEIHPHYPVDIRDEDMIPLPQEPKEGEAQKDLEAVEEELKTYDSRKDLSKREMLDYMSKLLQRQKLAARKLRESKEEEEEEEEKESEEPATDEEEN